MGEVIVTAIMTIAAALLGGGIVSLVMLGVNKRKAEQDIESQEIEDTERLKNIAMSLLEPLEKRIKQLEPLIPEVRGLKNQIKRYSQFTQQLLGGIRQLVAQLQELDEEPCWEPDDIPEGDWPPDDLEVFEYDT